MNSKITALFLIALSLALTLSSAWADNLVLPDDTIMIEEEAFMGDISLDSVILQDKIEKIGERAFKDSSITSITIPFGVKTIEFQTFMACRNLTEVNLPESVRTLEDCAFHQCSALEEIRLPSSLKTIGVQAFDDCDSLSSLVIPSGVTVISPYAFFSCNSLNRVTIPKSVVSIGEHAFLDCGEDLVLRVEADSAALQYAIDSGIPYELFEGRDESPASDFSFVDNGDGTCTVTRYLGAGGRVAVPERNDQGLYVTSVDNSAFEECKTITDVILPESVTELGSFAFCSCDNLESVIIRGNVTRINRFAFGYCGQLREVILPDSVTTLADSVFWECRQLSEINLPESLSFIGISAFEQCVGLSEITLPAELAYIDSYAFSNCSNLKKVTVLSMEIYISDTAFNNCGENMLLCAYEGSDAQKYASDYGISFESLNSWPPVEEKSFSVLAINFDPVFESAGGKRWHEFLDWNDPHELAAAFAADMYEASHGIVTYQIKEWIELDEMPRGEDGFVYDKEDYCQTLQAAIDATDGSYWEYSGWEDRGFNFDYQGYLDQLGVFDRVNSGEIDEVWVFAGPMHGNTMYETRMCGRNAFWCNSPGLEADCRRFVVYGFNYERGAAEMIHDAGHRMESILSEIFGWCDFEKDYEDYTDWEKFAAYDQVSPGRAGLGLIHFAPNSTSDYDWNNGSSVLSYCDDWYNYPNLTGEQRMVDCSEWNGDERDYIIWWFSHIPHAAGTNLLNMKYNNWWLYFCLDY